MRKTLNNNNINFAVFILSHGRPDKVQTLKSLKKSGYKGKWYIIIDNEDKTADQYYKNFGRDNVIMFDKLAISKTFDTADNFNDRRCIVYARNACFDIAKQLKIDYFIQFDDDYNSFRFRKHQKGHFLSRKIKDINRVFGWMIKFLKDTNAITVCMSQGGDLMPSTISEKSGVYSTGIARKAMNSFMCRTDRPINFIGRVNEDVNTYVRNASIGVLMFSIRDISLTQEVTQKTKGGMADMYLDTGTYLKSFYTVMYHPSSVVVKKMGIHFFRHHHSIKWKYTAVKILNEKYKKTA